MTEKVHELKLVRISHHPLGTRGRYVAWFLVTFSALVGLGNLAASLSRAVSAEPETLAKVSAYATPWRSAAWSDLARELTDTSQQKAALTTSLRLTPTSSSNWLKLAKLYLTPPVDSDRIHLGKEALRQAFEVAPQTPGLERARFALATISPTDATLEVALKRDLRRLVTRMANTEKFIKEARIFATPFGLEVLEAAVAEGRVSRLY